MSIYSSGVKEVPGMLVGGVDIGSTTAKAVLLGDGELVSGSIHSTETNPSLAGENTLKCAISDTGFSTSGPEYTIATGYGKVSASFADRTVTEITCHGRGVHFTTPEIRTVIDIGG